MGDYTKLIINCSVKKTDDVEKLRSEILEHIYVGSSAYHAGGDLLEIKNDWHHRTDISLITQTKYGRKIDDFLVWLAPQVIGGIGERDLYAIVLDEYSEEPTLYYLNEADDENGR